jgi:signal transduction histidine kinase/ActR/RegA family two-component response regulator
MSLSIQPVAHAPGSLLASSRSRTLARLRLTVVLAIVLPLFALIGAAGVLYDQTFSEARQRLDAVSRVAHEHALKMLETNQMLLARMLDLLGTSSDEQVLARSAEVHERLKEMASELPQVQGLFTHGADSRSLANSRVHPPPRHIDYTDRDWYAAHREERGSPVFVTEQLRSRATGEAIFDMSRRRVFADGSFAGTVHVSLRPEYFTSFWQEMTATTPGLRMAVLRADGRFIARWPDSVPEGGAVASKHPIMQSIAGGVAAASMDTTSAFDSGKRVLVYRKLGEYPLYVTTSFRTADVLARWAWRVGLLALFVVPLTAALAFMAWVALKRTREELDAVQRLEEETTRRQRSELALAQSQKLETVGQLAGGVAHDFNNLLMIVANNVHILRLRRTQGVERELAAIGRAVDSGTRLTRQLLALAGRQALAPERILLQERLQGMLDLVRPALPASVEIAAEVAPDTGPIFVDAPELELALINLALNARDAMEHGGRLGISARNAAPGEIDGRAGEQVVIEVTDTGSGIDAAIADRVAEPFFTTKSAGKGTGLGLSQVQALCRSAGGRMDIASRPGSGTRIRLSFPRATEGVERNHAADAPRADTGRQCALLLVEDNEALAQATRAVLESLGCRVRCANDAGAALRAIDEASFDVVLSDIEMPGELDGIELALQLSRRERPLPVVLMSGYAARIEQARALGLEAHAKPCSADVLRDAIDHALAGPRHVASLPVNP